LILAGSRVFAAEKALEHAQRCLINSQAAASEGQKMATIKINVYRDGRTWYNARWIDAEYDGSDPLGIADDASDDAAIEAAHRLELTVTGHRIVTRVKDVDSANGRFPNFEDAVQ
jgi:hypothetical protein